MNNEINWSLSRCSYQYICLNLLLNSWIKLELVYMMTDSKFTYRAVWIHRRLRNSMRTSIWSRAIPKAWNLYILCNHLSHSNMHSCIYPLDIHGQDIDRSRPRPWNLNGSLPICYLSHSCIICLCNSSVTTSLLPVPELDSTNAIKH